MSRDVTPGSVMQGVAGSTGPSTIHNQMPMASGFRASLYSVRLDFSRHLLTCGGTAHAHKILALSARSMPLRKGASAEGLRP